VRLFFAVALPPDVRESLAALGRELAERAPGAGVSWGPADNMHLTLRFLGDTADDVVPALHEAAREAARAVPRLELVLEGVGTFGGRSPRVIWVGLRQDAGREALVQLAGELERRVRVIGFEPADHAFSAHATLGRVRADKTNAKKTAALVAAVAKAKLGPLEVAVERFVLYESRLHGSRHPEYVEAASFALPEKSAAP